MINVRVDFNARGRGGAVKASLRRADGPIITGEKVLAVDEDEGMAFVAIVDAIEESGRVWLDVDWQAAPPLLKFEMGTLNRQLTTSAAR